VDEPADSGRYGLYGYMQQLVVYEPPAVYAEVDHCCTDHNEFFTVLPMNAMMPINRLFDKFTHRLIGYSDAITSLIGRPLNSCRSD
jgi:hypothetical protein